MTPFLFLLLALLGCDLDAHQRQRNVDQPARCARQCAPLAWSYAMDGHCHCHGPVHCLPADGGR